MTNEKLWDGGGRAGEVIAKKNSGKKTKSFWWQGITNEVKYVSMGGRIRRNS